jgi:hypothetical protein
MSMFFDRPTRFAYFLGAFAVLMFSAIFTLGSADLTQIVYDVLVPVLALIGAGISFRLYTEYRNGEAGKSVWGLMGLGFLFWSVGEVLWGIFELILKIDPYPSLADLFWLIGYIPFVLSFYFQYQTLSVHLDRATTIKIASVGFGVIIIAIIIVLIPISTSTDQGSLVEMMLAFLYPLSDIVLFVLALFLMLTLGGRLGSAWLIIAFGVTVYTFSDLIFIYTDWYKLYNYSNTLFNFLSIALYVIAYVIWDLGIITHYYARNENIQKKAPHSGSSYRQDTLQKIFTFFTDKSGGIVFLPDTFQKLRGYPGKEKLVGQPLDALLTIPSLKVASLFQRLTQIGSITQEGVKFIFDESPQLYTLTAIPSFDTGGVLIGADIILDPQTSFIESEERINSKAYFCAQIMYRVSQSAGRAGQGVDNLLRVYFVTVIADLYILLVRMGGLHIGEAFDELLTQGATRYDSCLHMKQGEITWSVSDVVPGAYSDMLEKANRYAVNVASWKTVQAEMAELEKFIDPTVMNAAERFGIKVTSRL